MKPSRTSSALPRIDALPLRLAPGRGRADFVDRAQASVSCLSLSFLGFSGNPGKRRRPYRRRAGPTSSAALSRENCRDAAIAAIIPKLRCRVVPMAKQPKALKMLTHGQVWGALDRLAERAGLSPSGLARRRARSHHLQQIQARHTRRPRTLALDGVAGQGAGATGSPDRHLCAADRRSRARSCSRCRCSASPKPAPRPFRCARLSRRQGLGRGGAACGRRGSRVCAGDFRRRAEAGLSRRRRHRGVAGHADPPRRPRGGEDQRPAR